MQHCTGANGIFTVDMSSIKCWSQGEEFPKKEKLRLIIETIAQNRFHCLNDETYLLISFHYWVARQLHKLLELVRQFLWAEQSSLNGVGIWSLLLGYSDADQWSRNRYNFWLSHWQSLKAGGNYQDMN